MIKYVELNRAGKVVMPREEFEQCLNDAWQDGYRAGRGNCDSSQWRKNEKITCNSSGKLKPLLEKNYGAGNVGLFEGLTDKIFCKHEKTYTPNSLLMRYIKDGHGLPPVGVDEDEYLKEFYNGRKD